MDQTSRVHHSTAYKIAPADAIRGEEGAFQLERWKPGTGCAGQVGADERSEAARWRRLVQVSVDSGLPPLY